MNTITSLQWIVPKGFSLWCFSDPLSFSHLSMLYTIILVSSPLYTCIIQVLFRYYLHINAARELVGRHLMWRQQLLKIFVASLCSSLIQCPTPHCDTTLKNVEDDKTIIITSGLHLRDDFSFSPRTYFRLSYTIFISSSYTLPIMTFI